MKQNFLNFSINLIKQNNNFDEVKIAELKYGLEAFYMLATKLVIIILLSIILHLFKELMLFLLLYIPLRGLGFGFHANTSLQCWIISTVSFLLLPYLAKVLVLPPLIIHSIILASTISFLFFAPADTRKKPLINTKKRLINKTLLVLISLLYLFSTLFINNNLIINTVAFTCFWQAVCVNPLLYKLFHQPFNNYKTYVKRFK